MFCRSICFAYAFLGFRAGVLVAASCEGDCPREEPGDGTQLLQSPIRFSQKPLEASAKKVLTKDTCAVDGQDPWATGTELPCCEGLYKCLMRGSWSYLCQATSDCPGCASCVPAPTSPPTSSPAVPSPSPTLKPESPTVEPAPTPGPATPAPTDECIEVDGDPFYAGKEKPCCSGLFKCLVPGIWAFRCRDSCAGCKSCDPAPTISPISQPSANPTLAPPSPTPAPPSPTASPAPLPTPTPTAPDVPVESPTPEPATPAPTDECVEVDGDPFYAGKEKPCCSGLFKCLVPGIWNYRCKDSCSGCSSCDPAPTTAPVAQPTSKPTPAPPTPAPTPAPPTPPTPTEPPSASPTTAPSSTPLPTPEPVPVTVKVMQWNVHYTNKNTRHMADVIVPNQVDVVGLNEFTADSMQLTAYLTEMSGRTFQEAPGTGEFMGFGTDIWYDDDRWEALEGGKQSIGCPGTRGGNRAAVWVVLRCRLTKATFITGGIHLSYCAGGCDWVHRCELGELYDRFENCKRRYGDVPVIWMGDLNRAITDTVVAELLNGRIGDRTVFPVADFAQTEGNTYFSGGRAIDHALGEPANMSFIKGGRTGQGVRGSWLNGADHFPIYSLFSLGPQAPTPEPTPRPAGECVGKDEDPYSFGPEEFPCCPGLNKCLVIGVWSYRCTDSCDNCQTCDPAPAPEAPTPAPSPTPPPTTAPTAPTPAPTTPAPTPSPKPTPAPAPCTIRVMQWNVHYMNKNVNMMADVIKPNEVDVVGLNEFTANTPGLTYALSTGQTPSFQEAAGVDRFLGYGTDIWYDSNRFDSLEGGKETVKCPGSKGGNRAATWVVLIERLSGHMFVTGGIHLSYCAGGCDTVHECELNYLYDRFYDVKKQFSQYGDIPVVWMGDLNRVLSDRVIQNLLRGKIGNRDVFSVSDMAQTNTNTYYTGGEAIDHILGEENLLTFVKGGRTGQGVTGTKLSGADHFPIYSEMLLGPKVPTPPPTPRPPGMCTQKDEDPYTYGTGEPCCDGLYLCLLRGLWVFRCVVQSECGACHTCEIREELSKLTNETLKDMRVSTYGLIPMHGEASAGVTPQ